MLHKVEVKKIMQRIRALRCIFPVENESTLSAQSNIPWCKITTRQHHGTAPCADALQHFLPGLFQLAMHAKTKDHWKPAERSGNVHGLFGVAVCRPDLGGLPQLGQKSLVLADKHRSSGQCGGYRGFKKCTTIR